MVQNMAKVAKMARNLAIAHIIVGFLLICFGIGDRLVEFHNRCRWTGEAYFGIWIGIWVSIICHLISEFRLHDSSKTKVTVKCFNGMQGKKTLWNICNFVFLIYS